MELFDRKHHHFPWPEKRGSKQEEDFFSLFPGVKLTSLGELRVVVVILVSFKLTF